MKRSGPQIQQPSTRKRYFSFLHEEELPFKLRLLENWKLTDEVAQYLKESRTPQCTLKDRTNPQLSLVVYKPNIYQQLLDFFQAEKRQQEWLESDMIVDFC